MEFLICPGLPMDDYSGLKHDFRRKNVAFDESALFGRAPKCPFVHCPAQSSSGPRVTKGRCFSCKLLFFHMMNKKELIRAKGSKIKERKSDSKKLLKRKLKRRDNQIRYFIYYASQM